ncbi:MAG: 16S rRNA (uracil(1498)-N(3))-methyltransferase [Candidatus Sumerlaeota bacterium]|nr:16S rRNA (uracil(1498)-N(3))-methyltransferase [Candidatus Sumerlaeota bacterium]
MRRFWRPISEFAEGQTIALDAEESAHAARVLRLRLGERVLLFDGEGREFEAELTEVSARRTVCRLLHPTQPAPELPLDVTLAFGLAKHDATEWMIQKAVELGVAQLRPFVCARAVPRIKEPSRSRMERWRRIIRDATKQCGRARLARIEEPADWPAIIAQTPPDAARIICWEESREDAPRLSQALAGMIPGSRRAIWLAIGPEGGFAPEEIALAREAGYQECSLGPRILRAETAAIAALAVVAAAIGEL